MQNTNPDNPSQQPSRPSNPDPQARPAAAQDVSQLGPVPNTPRPAAAQNIPQPGYPYVAQYTQPGYAQPVAPVPANPAAGVPAHGAVPETPVAQAGAPVEPARTKGRSAAIFALTCLLAVVFGVGLFSGWTFAHANTATNQNAASNTSPSKTVSTALDIQTEREAAIAKATPAVVEVIGQVSQGTALGSGVIVDKNGDIITNYHVVEGASTLQVVLSNGRAVPAQLVGTDAANDLAVLRIQPYSGMSVATLGDSSKLTIGQEVLAIGNPLGYSGTATSGVVSALNRNAQETRSVHLTGLIQISTPINPGNSGGALINLQGEVVGIPTLAAVNSETNTPANGIGFAIPSSQVKAALTQILG